MDKKQIAGLIFSSMTNKNFDQVSEYFADNLVLDFPGLGNVKTKRKVIIALKAILRKYTKLSFFVDKIIQENDEICVLWHNEGIRTDEKLYKNTGLTYIRFEENKIVFLSDYFKDTSFVNQ
jgi:NhaP-type Na+/H+ and K+/H+ antiporter